MKFVPVADTLPDGDVDVIGPVNSSLPPTPVFGRMLEVRYRDTGLYAWAYESELSEDNDG